LDSADLSLAKRALAGDRAALGVVDGWLVQEAQRTAKRLKLDASLADELAQKLRQVVLAPPSPKLAAYQGLGSLQKWLRASAMRLGINLSSAEGRHRGDDDDAQALEQLEASAASPELSLMKHEASALFQQALARAFAALEPSERNLLRMYFLDGVSSAQLAKAHGAHPVTVTRWLTAARAKVVDAAVAELRGAGLLSTPNLADLRWLVRSHLSEGWADVLRRTD